MTNPEPALSELLDRQGYAFLHAPASRAWLEASGGLADWDRFAASWEGMPLDTYMADGGKYRRRRHAVYKVEAGSAAMARQPDQPHYQGLDYNALNGGIERWFEPMQADIAATETLQTILAATRELFDGLAADADWHIELHQFRIEANAGSVGQPTPEGHHRDGVDFVLVLLIARENIASGTTTVHDIGHAELGSFTLTDPLDAALVDDHRVSHGVTAVLPLDPSLPAHRDVLVVTYRRVGASAAAS